MYDESPFLTFWEVSRACELACFHCRASAIPRRDPRELSTAEGFGLLDAIRDLGCRVVVLTGGDPMMRDDLESLVEHGTRIGLSMALTPSATPRVTHARLSKLRDAGLARLAISIDSADPAIHDGYRGVTGSHARSLDILAMARALGLGTQINTTLTRRNVHELDAMAAEFAELAIGMWSVFFVVPTGRASIDLMLGADEVEDVLVRLADLEETAPYAIKTTAAQHYRRVLRQRKQAQHHPSPHDGIGRATRPVGDGQGIVFVSHRGDVSPSGFLPVVLGNVRETPIATLYRDHPTMRVLRDVEALGGKCGACEFKHVCGGSRARAFAVTGDMSAADPACAYVPRGFLGDEQAASTTSAPRRSPCTDSSTSGRSPNAS